MPQKDERTGRPEDAKRADANPDPVTGAPGSHPVGTGVGALAGGAAGMAAGALGGPVGAAAGAAVGAVVGGLAGKGAAEAINPTEEDAYWREQYRHRPYARAGEEYETYRPAYQYGWESRAQHAGRRFDEVEPELARDWETKRGQSKLNWESARPVTRDAWDRVEHRSSASRTGGTTPGRTGPAA